ncbi:hypothetical protein [Streptomyces halobius]|uniref:Uncharacterized protein n=1 Tax=Streptomyces halobius TaxID=2879846 RepID=A0ABY4M991_9ACTN|nr:hypothetical protein [Streptomyces halobius]UQA92965.1 hypothetical protein K9S39_14975 [Streptomyces halobius]
MSTLKKAKNFKKSKPGLYLSIGGSVFGAISAVKQIKEARAEQDKLQLVDALVSAAAVVTSVALLVREIKRLGGDDVLAD